MVRSEKSSLPARSIKYIARLLAALFFLAERVGFEPLHSTDSREVVDSNILSLRSLLSFGGLLVQNRVQGRSMPA